MPYDTCRCGAPKDARARLCRDCWASDPEKPRGRGTTGHTPPNRRTRAEVAALLLDTAEPWGDCLLATMGQDVGGYRRVPAEGRLSLAHRLIVEVRLGRELLPRPAETVDHTCHNADVTCSGGPTCWHRRCVNPDHLTVATLQDNWNGGRRGAPDQRRSLTECPHGHAYDEANTYVNPTTGARTCRRCRADRAAAARAAKRS